MFYNFYLPNKISIIFVLKTGVFLHSVVKQLIFNNNIFPKKIQLLFFNEKYFVNNNSISINDIILKEKFLDKNLDLYDYLLIK